MVKPSGLGGTLFPVSRDLNQNGRTDNSYQQPVLWGNYDYNSISRVSETQGARTLTFGYRQEIFAFFPSSYFLSSGNWRRCIVLLIVGQEKLSTTRPEQRMTSRGEGGG